MLTKFSRYPFAYSRGESRPLGATVREGGVNFSIYSEHATAVELLLFDECDGYPKQIVRLESRHHRNFNYWHVFVHGASEEQIYAYRVFGPWAPERGMLYDSSKVLLDPYARAIVYGDGRSRYEAVGCGDNVTSAMKCMVVGSQGFDWEGAKPPRIHAHERIIYELHVRGFTRHHSSCVVHPGTYQGLVEKIPYLLDLGVTTVELLPVFQFDSMDPLFEHAQTGKPVHDYWGYNPIGFFAPHHGYGQGVSHKMSHVHEFKRMVRAFHQAGLEVFLDVVFNHTSEAGPDGPTFSFRGIDNAAYYMLQDQNLSKYADFSGCGNTVNCNHPVVRRLILDSLRYWVEEMQVDGFRFDLASILSRDQQGRPLLAPPLTWEIESDPLLERATLIAEAWDAAGLYQVGAFPGERWSEWNGQFRDDVRAFWRRDMGLVSKMANRVLGSPDLYEHSGRQPTQCVNFLTSHDGFTLRDLTSYAHKHNESNGEQNRDGDDHNVSMNYGVEGDTQDPYIVAHRARHTRNLLTTLFVSQGTPMLLAGDEFGRTQHGNNNSWCQDNELSWVDWTDLDRHRDVHRFVRELIAWRKRHPGLRRDRFLLGLDAASAQDPKNYTRVSWHGVVPDQANWSFESRFLTFTWTESEDDVAIHIILNAHQELVHVTLPNPPQGSHWLRVIDTSRPSPRDILEFGHEERLESAHLAIQAQSAVVLVQSPGFKAARDLPW